MRVIVIYTNDLAPAVTPTDNVVKIEEVTIDNEPAVKVTKADATFWTMKHSTGQIVVQWW